MTPYNTHIYKSDAEWIRENHGTITAGIAFLAAKAKKSPLKSITPPTSTETASVQFDTEPYRQIRELARAMGAKTLHYLHTLVERERAKK